MQSDSRVSSLREFRDGSELVDGVGLQAGLELRVDDESNVKPVVVDCFG